MKKLKYDFILIFALLVLSGIIIFFMNNKKTGNSVQVYKNNELIATYPLDADNEYKIKNGNEYNILKIEKNIPDYTLSEAADKNIYREYIKRKH